MAKLVNELPEFNGIYPWDQRRFTFVLDIPDQFLKPTITQGN